ncbi:hypothetical protein [Ruegeria profundi]|uniref:hypothetical protein n=1 Tax=Ruegeria profundi TaxID=1685378 RepID=UPI001CD767C9|nr:hypothetical protein [Ruegeria profundi]MCA0929187.1 hypothetical protein [Ruegeria profundi]
MPSLKRVETLVLLVPVGFLALCLIFYVTIACAIPVSWPYYIPSVQGATIKDPKQFFYPRANLTPRAVYPLTDGVNLEMWVSCTQSNFAGEQECHFIFDFFNPYNAVVVVPEQIISVRSPNGEELIDKGYITEFADRFSDPDYHWPKVLGENVYIEIPEDSSRNLAGRIGDALSLGKKKFPPSFKVLMPNIQINGQTVTAPEVEFIRKRNITCVGLLTI